MDITRSLRSVYRADTRRIGETIPTPVHQRCPAGCDLAETTPDNRLLAPLSCPSCRHEHDAPVRVTVETSRRAANRPASPEIVHICPGMPCPTRSGTPPCPARGEPGMNAQTFADVGIEIPPGAYGEVDTVCPQCSHTRKKSRARCLSVNTITERWFCHHCGWAGALGIDGAAYGAPLRHRAATPTPLRVYTVPQPPPSEPLPASVIDWFAHRAIPEPVLTDAGITAGQEFCRNLAARS